MKLFLSDNTPRISSWIFKDLSGYCTIQNQGCHWVGSSLPLLRVVTHLFSSLNAKDLLSSKLPLLFLRCDAFWMTITFSIRPLSYGYSHLASTFVTRKWPMKAQRGAVWVWDESCSETNENRVIFPTSILLLKQRNKRQSWAEKSQMYFHFALSASLPGVLSLKVNSNLLFSAKPISKGFSQRVRKSHINL